jgi:hypothetical protein
MLPKGRRRSSFLCQSLTYGLLDNSDKPGKNHSMYYLTQAGLDRAYWEFEVEFQGESGLQANKLWIPTEHNSLSNDYHHRRHYVSAHIAIRQWVAKVGAKVDFWQHYYQANPKRPKIHGRPPSVNHVLWDQGGDKYCTPDGLLGVTYEGKSRIYILELHHRTPTKLVLDQLYRDFRAAPAIRNKFPSYTVTSDPYLLSAFTDPMDKGAVQKQVDKTPAFAAVRTGLIFADVQTLGSVLQPTISPDIGAGDNGAAS